MRSSYRLLAIAVAAALLVGACAGSTTPSPSSAASAGPVRGGTLVYAIWQEPATLAPNYGNQTVTTFVNQRMGHWGEAILHLGARRDESSTRAQAMAGRETRNGLRRHPDFPCVWVSNPIEHRSTEEVWAYIK